MEVLILSVTVYIYPSQPPASGPVLECLPATACGPTAPVSGCRPPASGRVLECLPATACGPVVYIAPSPQPTAGKRPCARVPTGHCLRTNGTSGVHRSQPPADRRQAAVCSNTYRPLLADQRHQWCTSIPAPSRPLASGRALECLPATACGPTAPVVYIDPSPQLTAGKRLCARVPTGHCLRTNGTSGVHRSQPPADRWQAAVCSSAYRPLLADQRHQWCTSIPAPS